MQMAILVVVVCAVSGIADDAPLAAAFPGQLPVTLLSLAAAPLAAWYARRLLEAELRQAGGEVRAVQRQWEAWHEFVTWLWAGSALAVLYVGRWPQIVRSSEWTLAWPLVDELLILAPLLADLLLVWLASYGVDRLLRNAAGEAPLGLRLYVTLRMRHHFGLTVLPALAIVGIQETAARLHWTGGVDDQRAWWLWGILLAATSLGLPLLLRWLWRTQRVGDSPLKRRLLASCRRLGCGVHDILVWRTGGTLANAAVAGLLPGLRTIFLSDGLIARLSDDELDVVVRHEAAHLARRHVWQRMMILALPVLVYFALRSQCPQALAAVGDGLVAVGIAPVWQMTLVMPLAVMAYAVLLMGWLARMHEHDADLAACTWGGRRAVDAGAVAALRSALVKLVGDCDEYRRGRWLHPSVIERVAFLQSASDNPLLATRFRERLLWVCWLLVVVCAVAIGIGLWPVS